MPEPTEHHRDELFSCAYIAACNQSEIAFPQIVTGQEMALPHLLNPECQDADVKAVLAFHCLIPAAQICMVKGCRVRKPVAGAHFLDLA